MIILSVLCAIAYSIILVAIWRDKELIRMTSYKVYLIHLSFLFFNFQNSGNLKIPILYSFLYSLISYSSWNSIGWIHVFPLVSSQKKEFLFKIPISVYVRARLVRRHPVLSPCSHGNIHHLSEHGYLLDSEGEVLLLLLLLLQLLLSLYCCPYFARMQPRVR